jgi:hypothetical protein
LAVQAFAVCRWRGLLAYGLALAGVTIPVMAVLQITSHGWFGYYVFELPMTHGMKGREYLIVNFWKDEISTSGEVLVVNHPHLAMLAGKSMYAHQMAIVDVYEAERDPRGVRELLRTKWLTMLQQKRFDRILLDNDWYVYWPELNRYYRLEQTLEHLAARPERRKSPGEPAVLWTIDRTETIPLDPIPADLLDPKTATVVHVQDTAASYAIGPDGTIVMPETAAAADFGARGVVVFRRQVPLVAGATYQVTLAASRGADAMVSMGGNYSEVSAAEWWSSYNFTYEKASQGPLVAFRPRLGRANQFVTLSARVATGGGSGRQLMHLRGEDQNWVAVNGASPTRASDALGGAEARHGVSHMRHLASHPCALRPPWFAIACSRGSTHREAMSQELA